MSNLHALNDGPIIQAIIYLRAHPMFFIRRLFSQSIQKSILAQHLKTPELLNAQKAFKEAKVYIEKGDFKMAKESNTTALKEANNIPTQDIPVKAFILQILRLDKEINGRQKPSPSAKRYFYFFYSTTLFKSSKFN